MTPCEAASCGGSKPVGRPLKSFFFFLPPSDSHASVASLPRSFLFSVGSHNIEVWRQAHRYFQVLTSVGRAHLNLDSCRSHITYCVAVAQPGMSYRRIPCDCRTITRTCEGERLHIPPFHQDLLLSEKSLLRLS